MHGAIITTPMNTGTKIRRGVPAGCRISSSGHISHNHASASQICPGSNAMSANEWIVHSRRTINACAMQSSAITSKLCSEKRERDNGVVIAGVADGGRRRLSLPGRAVFLGARDYLEFGRKLQAYARVRMCVTPAVS